MSEDKKMQISASMVKQLREKTGAGMMDCKKALGETEGDFEQAVNWLRKKGIAKAAKKADRVASEGLAFAYSEGKKGVLIEVNAETDFVAKNEQFTQFVQDLAELVHKTGETNIEKLTAMDWPAGGTVADQLTELVATIGENMSVRRAAVLSVSKGAVASYVHMNGKIAVLTALSADEENEKLQETARNVAMHVAAANPQALDRDSVDPEVVEKEKQVLVEQAKQSGKPDNIIEKMVEGRMNKFFEEICLTEQAFIMDTDQKVKDVVSNAASGARVADFARFELGEGVEKKEEDFASEVASMAQ